MKNPPVMEFDGRRIRAVVFDAFGTLVHIGDKRRPYRQLLTIAEKAGRKPQPEDAARVMSMNCGLAGVADWLGCPVSLAVLSALEQDLYAELPTIKLYPEALAVLYRLKDFGLRIGVCSNLATPYAIPIKTLLPFELDAYAWSFEVGAAKPSPLIYQSVCERLSLPAEEILMIGDTHAADYLGPSAFGMNALLLVREGDSPERIYIRTLEGLLRILQIADV